MIAASLNGADRSFQKRTVLNNCCLRCPFYMKRHFEKAFQLLARMSAKADMQVYGKKGKQGFIMLKAEKIYKILLTAYGKPRW